MSAVKLRGQVRLILSFRLRAEVTPVILMKKIDIIRE